TGPMLGCRFAIPRMVERGGGVIVNTASAAAFYGSTSLAAYGTTKAGIVALTRYVATAYASHGIRCNAVAPGVVVARAVQEAAAGDHASRLARYVDAHLTSDDAAFVTGETLRVDGGLTAHSPMA